MVFRQKMWTLFLFLANLTLVFTTRYGDQRPIQRNRQGRFLSSPLDMLSERLAGSSSILFRLIDDSDSLKYRNNNGEELGRRFDSLNDDYPNDSEEEAVLRGRNDIVAISKLIKKPHIDLIEEPEFSKIDNEDVDVVSLPLEHRKISEPDPEEEPDDISSELEEVMAWKPGKTSEEEKVQEDGSNKNKPVRKYFNNNKRIRAKASTRVRNYGFKRVQAANSTRAPKVNSQEKLQTLYRQSIADKRKRPVLINKIRRRTTTASTTTTQQHHPSTAHVDNDQPVTDFSSLSLDEMQDFLKQRANRVKAVTTKVKNGVTNPTLTTLTAKPFQKITKGEAIATYFEAVPKESSTEEIDHDIVRNDIPPRSTFPKPSPTTIFTFTAPTTTTTTTTTITTTTITTSARFPTFTNSKTSPSTSFVPVTRSDFPKSENIHDTSIKPVVRKNNQYTFYKKDRYRPNSRPRMNFDVIQKVEKEVIDKDASDYDDDIKLSLADMMDMTTFGLKKVVHRGKSPYRRPTPSKRPTPSPTYYKDLPSESTPRPFTTTSSAPPKFAHFETKKPSSTPGFESDFYGSPDAPVKYFPSAPDDFSTLDSYGSNEPEFTDDEDKKVKLENVSKVPTVQTPIIYKPVKGSILPEVRVPEFDSSQEQSPANAETNFQFDEDLIKPSQTSNIDSSSALIDYYNNRENTDNYKAGINTNNKKDGNFITFNIGSPSDSGFKIRDSVLDLKTQTNGDSDTHFDNPYYNYYHPSHRYPGQDADSAVEHTTKSYIKPTPFTVRLKTKPTTTNPPTTAPIYKTKFFPTTSSLPKYPQKPTPATLLPPRFSQTPARSNFRIYQSSFNRNSVRQKSPKPAVLRTANSLPPYQRPFTVRPTEFKKRKPFTVRSKTTLVPYNYVNFKTGSKLKDSKYNLEFHKVHDVSLKDPFEPNVSFNFENAPSRPPTPKRPLIHNHKFPRRQSKPKYIKKYPRVTFKPKQSPHRHLNNPFQGIDFDQEPPPSAFKPKKNKPYYVDNGPAPDEDIEVPDEIAVAKKIQEQMGENSLNRSPVGGSEEAFGRFPAFEPPSSPTVSSIKFQPSNFPKELVDDVAFGDLNFKLGGSLPDRPVQSILRDLPDADGNPKEKNAYLNNPFGSDFIRLEIDIDRFQHNKSEPIGIHHIPLMVKKKPNMMPRPKKRIRKRPLRPNVDNKPLRPPPPLLKKIPVPRKSFNQPKRQFQTPTNILPKMGRIEQHQLPLPGAAPSQNKAIIHKVKKAMDTLPNLVQKIMSNSNKWVEDTFTGRDFPNKVQGSVEQEGTT